MDTEKGLTAVRGEENRGCVRRVTALRKEKKIKTHGSRAERRRGGK